MPHRIRSLLKLGVFAFLGLGLWTACSSAPPPFSCTDPLGCVDLKPGEPVKIGVIQALSGKVAPLGLEQTRGLELALDRRGRTVLGRPVALLVEDTGCRAEGGANAALKIVADTSVVAIFGTTCSGDAATAAEILAEAGLTMISGNNSAPFLTSIAGSRAPKWQPGFFRTAPNEEHAGPAAATFAFEKLGIRRAATIHDGDLYTRGLAEGFKRQFELLGGTIVLHAAVGKGDSDMAPILTAVENTQAELIFFPLFQPEGNALLRAARRTPGLERIVLMSDGSLIENSFLEDVGQAAVGMYFVGPAPKGDTAKQERLEAEYRRAYSMPPPTTYYQSAFDAANILLDAIVKVAVQGPDGSAHVGRKALRDALYATRGHQGVWGLLNCDAFGDCAAPAFNVLRLDDPGAGVVGLKANVVFAYEPR